MDKILCLTTSQPMAWALFNGCGSDERNYTTGYRGKLLIYATTPNIYQLRLINKNLISQNILPPEISTLPQSAIIGSVNLTGISRNSNSYIWHFENPQAWTEAMPYHHHLPLFEIPLDALPSCNV